MGSMILLQPRIHTEVRSFLVVGRTLITDFGLHLAPFLFFKLRGPPAGSPSPKGRTGLPQGWLGLLAMLSHPLLSHGGVILFYPPWFMKPHIISKWEMADWTGLLTLRCATTTLLHSGSSPIASAPWKFAFSRELTRWKFTFPLRGVSMWHWHLCYFPSHHEICSRFRFIDASATPSSKGHPLPPSFPTQPPTEHTPDHHHCLCLTLFYNARPHHHHRCHPGHHTEARWPCL